MWRKLKLRLRDLASGDRVDEEMQLHLDELTSMYVEQGMSPRDAATAARRQFGNALRLREEARTHLPGMAVQAVLRDIRLACRRLRRSPVFTLATAVTLALGIGANTAIFTIVDGVLLKPLPFERPDELVGVWQTAPGVNIRHLNASIADYVTYREHSRTFADVAIWTGGSATVVKDTDAERVDALATTFRLLPLLGIAPLAGRDFREADNDTASPEVVMISHGYWQRRFGGDPAIIGQRLMVDGTAREIIAVLPRGFWFMDAGHDLVAPLRFSRANVRLANYSYNGIARLRPGATIAEADADVRRMIAIALDTLPPPNGMSREMMDEVGLAPNVRPLMTDLLTGTGEDGRAAAGGDIGTSLWVTMATIAVLLFAACANVANLLLVRSEGRVRDYAVLAALGASRWRLARELLVECVMLAAAGGLLGLVFAAGVVRLVLALSPARLPRADQIGIDATTLLFTLAVSLAAGVLLGLLPVLKHTRVTGSILAKAAARAATAGRERQLTRFSLTAVQVALALVLLIGSMLMVRTFYALRGVDPGFSRPDRLQAVMIAMPPTVASTAAARLELQRRLAERLGAIAGVESVGLVNRLPMTGARSRDPVAARDHVYAPKEIPPLRRFVSAAPGAFATLGVPLKAGREYTWSDMAADRPVAIIGEHFAREYWGSASAAVGKQIRSGPQEPWSEVIGVVGDIRHDGLMQPAPSTVYWPLRNAARVYYVLRTSRAGTAALGEDIRRGVSDVTAGLAMAELQTMQDVYARSMSRTSFTVTLLAVSGIMALLLAVVGLYAVISYGVTQQFREIGIRMALGAEPRAVRWLFVRRGLLWTAVGSAAGLGAAVALSGAIRALLFNVQPIDLPTYAGALAAVVAAAALASYLPTRRFSRIALADALKAD